MQIIDQTLHIDGQEIPLPAVTQDAKVKAWRVPTEYRDTGFFVSVILPAQTEEIPACSPADAEYVGECDYPAPESAKLTAAKAAKLADINTECDKAVFALTATYPQAEIQSWPQQVKEADAYAADPQAAVPLLESIAVQRGLSVAELVQRVHAKVQAYAVASGYLIGKRQAYEDAIDAAQTLQEVEAVQWSL